MSLRIVVFASVCLTSECRNSTALDDFCSSLCSCDDGCTDCDPYIDEAKGINCPTGGCDSNASPLSCHTDNATTVADVKTAPGNNRATKAAQMRFHADATRVDAFCCSLCACEDGCTDCDPYVDDVKGLNCSHGGCDANARPLACDAKICPAAEQTHSKSHFVV
eukprot:CAMPEP_0169119838 /NCGR_PEP_ID=MMETSP1015-20121227/31779_1 /TAXON_ID=342587 /ORGANISM="Karlodinium micrum, Strain CCMP2283" /LENGTH=163 /DNA_ID=CAMNT_0009182763 /DNA_START=54 /DNA_END=545 /DNA_ORIENTATION=-